MGWSKLKLSGQPTTNVDVSNMPVEGGGGVNRQLYRDVWPTNRSFFGGTLGRDIVYIYMGKLL